MTVDSTPPPLPAVKQPSRLPPLLKSHRGRPRPLREAGRWLRILGPGLITGAADDDPSGIGTYSQAGASFGTGQLWLALYMLPLLITVQEMCGRIGLVTGRGIAAVVRQHYNRKLLFGAVALVVIANTINVGADLGAMTASVQLLVPGVPFLVVLCCFALGMLALEVFVPYRRYATVLKVLTLSLLAYIVTGLIVGANWGAVLRATLVPTLQGTPAFLALVVGVLGTTISPYLFFWQASEQVEEQQGHHRQQRGTDEPRKIQAMHFELRSLRLDTVFGMLASEVTTWFIIFTVGSTLYTHGVTTITTADQAASALAPLVKSFPHAGDLARLLFALGIVGTGLLAVPVLAGSAAYAVAEAFGWHEGLARSWTHARGFYGVIALATVVGLGLNLLGINPITALVYTAIINGVVAVPLLVLILLVANNSTIMGSYTNGMLSNSIGIFTTVAMGAAAVAAIVFLF
jgi:NRAMP (natural resistance-associated macrophage protein)-like metal ion transporter